jgi:hypothetical protein
MLVAGAVLGSTGMAAATTAGRTFFLRPTDDAVLYGGDTVCRAVGQGPVRGSAAAFRCRVGGDYRAKYGVIISNQSVQLTQYTGFDRYRVVLRKRQSPVTP